MAKSGYPSEFRRRVIGLIERGRKVAELAAARKRIRELEAELAIHRRAAELLKEDSRGPKGSSRRSR